jgi:DDE superfamily endonuclease
LSRSAKISVLLWVTAQLLAAAAGYAATARAPDIQVESKGFRLGGFRDSLPQGGDLRCRKPIRSIYVNVLPALSVRAGRGTLPRPILHRLVFLDETGTTTKMTRLRGRCLKGQRLRSKVPFGHWKTQTFIAGLRCHGLTAPFVVDAPMNRRIFETYVETQLAPTSKRAMSSSWTTCQPTKARPPRRP